MLRDGKIQLQRNVIDIQYRLGSQDRQVRTYSKEYLMTLYGNADTIGLFLM